MGATENELKWRDLDEKLSDWQERVIKTEGKLESCQERISKVDDVVRDIHNKTLSFYDRMGRMEATNSRLDDKMAQVVGHSMESKGTIASLQDSMNRISTKMDKLPENFAAVLQKHEEDCPARENTRRKIDRILDKGSDPAIPITGKKIPIVRREFVQWAVGIGAVIGGMMFAIYKLVQFFH